MKLSTLPAASVLAVVGLVVFQLSWMWHSRRLSEELFNQRVCMALCSAVEDYGGGVLCRQQGAALCVPELGSDIYLDPATDTAFQAGLRRALDFYQINLDFRVSLVEEKQPCGLTHQCAVTLPQSGGNEAYVTIDFPGKTAFIAGKMAWMVLATVLILLFTAGVLFAANRLLRKQKSLLQTNVDFFNNMAHEFRTPLTNMGLALNMLTKKQPELQDNRLVGILHRENARLLGEVERVLHLASLDNGDFALQKERISLKALLRSVLDDLELGIAERQAQVSLGDVPDHLEVFGDRLHLANVFRNLLDNALKYSPEHPEVQITVREQAKGVVVTVEDKGIGIPADQRALIFEKFQRASRGDVHEQKGFGLGLAYVKSMVEMHRGFVRVFSEERRGSRFEVFLPSFSPAS